jgi:hypothetical protein
MELTGLKKAAQGYDLCPERPVITLGEQGDDFAGRSPDLHGKMLTEERPSAREDRSRRSK